MYHTNAVAIGGNAGGEPRTTTPKLACGSGGGSTKARAERVM